MATPGPASPADLQQQASTAFQLLALQQVSAGLLASSAAAAPMPMPMPWPAAAAAGGGGGGAVGGLAATAAAAATAVASMAPLVLPGPLVHLGGMNVVAAPTGSVLQQHQLYTSLGLVGLVPLRGIPLMMPVPQLQLVGGNQLVSMQPTMLLAPPQQPPPPPPQRCRQPQQPQQQQPQQQQPFVMVPQALPQQQQQQQRQLQQALLLAPAAAPAAAAPAAPAAAAASGPDEAPTTGSSSAPSRSGAGPGRLDGSAPEQPVSREALTKLFHLPLGQAAKQLGLGQTQFKVHARRHGIPKWPFRKRQSVDQLITSIEAYAQTTTEAAELVAPALLKLRSFLAAIEHDPDINLDQPLKKLRQAFFKETHKLRQRARRSDGPGHGVEAAAAGPAGGYDDDDGEFERDHHQGQGAAAGGWPGVWSQAAAAEVQAAAAAGGGRSGQHVVAPGQWPPGWSGPYPGDSGVPHQQQPHQQQHAAHELEDDGLAGVVGQVPSCFAAFGGEDEDFMQLGAAPLSHTPRSAATAGPAAAPTAPVAAPFSPKAAAAAPAAAAPPGPAAPAAGALVPGSGGLGLVQLLQAG